MDSGTHTPSNPESRVAALAQDVKRLRGRFDQDRRLPDELIAAMVRADLFRLAVPRSMGGEQLGFADWFGIMETAAGLDGSMAWVLTNSIIMGRMAGFLSVKACGDWFTTPDCMIAGSTAAVGRAEPVTGGYKVTGVWPFVSGIHAARRVMGLCELVGVDDPIERMICAFLPMECVEVRDDWHSSGLRGSGSCTVEARDVFVAAEHVVPFLAHRPWLGGDPYHLPHLSVFPFSVTLVALGIVNGAINDFTAMADRTRGGTSSKLADRELIQTELGRAITLHRAAKALVQGTLAELEVAFATTAPNRKLPRALFRASLAQAAELCEMTMSILCRAAGTSAILESGTFERRQRDLATAARHVAMGAQNLTVLGRVHLGLDPGTLRF